MQVASRLQRERPPLSQILLGFDFLAVEPDLDSTSQPLVEDFGRDLLDLRGQVSDHDGMNSLKGQRNSLMVERPSLRATLGEPPSRVPVENRPVSAVIALDDDSLRGSDIRETPDALGADEVLSPFRRPHESEVLALIEPGDRDAGPLIDKSCPLLYWAERNPDVLRTGVDRVLEVLAHEGESSIRIEGTKELQNALDIDIRGLRAHAMIPSATTHRFAGLNRCSRYGFLGEPCASAGHESHDFFCSASAR